MIHSRADSLAQMDSEDVVKASVLSGHNESILVKLKQFTFSWKETQNTLDRLCLLDGLGRPCPHRKVE